MNWINKEIPKDHILCLWPATVVEDGDNEDVIAFFENNFGVTIVPLGTVTTLPSRDNNGNNISETGGRIDFFFWLDCNDISRFAVPRLSWGIRWWEDVYFNKQEDIYPQAFLDAYPDYVKQKRNGDEEE